MSQTLALTNYCDDGNSTNRNWTRFDSGLADIRKSTVFYRAIKFGRERPIRTRGIGKFKTRPRRVCIRDVFAFLAYRKISHESRRSSKSGVTISPLIFAIEQRPRSPSPPRRETLFWYFRQYLPPPPSVEGHLFPLLREKRFASYRGIANKTVDRRRSRHRTEEGARFRL